MECLAVIPASSGLQNAPRKHLREFGGKPLIAHVIASALQATRVNRVVVSTDDRDIDAVAARYGAEVIRRPESSSSAIASAENALVHALDTLKQRESYEPELVILLQHTAPLTIAGDLDGAIGELINTGADSCFTAVPVLHSPWERQADGFAARVKDAGSTQTGTRESSAYCRETGAAYVMKTDSFRRAGNRFCGNVVPHIVDLDRCLEITTELDFVKADAAFQYLRERRPLPADLDAVVFDFDGVFTNNRVLVMDDGHEAVVCDRGDGLGLEMLRQHGFELMILSKERNPVVARRAEKLRLPYMQAIDDKPTALKEWAHEHNLALERIAFVGNDINDVASMGLVGFAACPADAHPAAKQAADLILTRNGGQGAIRELCDMLIGRLRAEKRNN